VLEYEEDADKITITTTGRTFYKGDILIGADGIHSHVRTLISKHIEKIDGPLSKDLNNCKFSFNTSIIIPSR
jgi:2-polyprenyl-6-methoxyphenol hydroxylase and related FAD-dependent oxidoreductases